MKGGVGGKFVGWPSERNLRSEIKIFHLLWAKTKEFADLDDLPISEV